MYPYMHVCVYVCMYASMCVCILTFFSRISKEFKKTKAIAEIRYDLTAGSDIVCNKQVNLQELKLCIV